MRTALTIDDDLLREAKARAARSGSTVSQVIEDAVRAAFVRKTSGKADPIRLPTSPGAPRRGIDLDNLAALPDVMEEPER